MYKSTETVAQLEKQLTNESSQRLQWKNIEESSYVSNFQSLPHMLTPYSIYNSKMCYLTFQIPWSLIACGHLLINQKDSEDLYRSGNKELITADLYKGMRD